MVLYLKKIKTQRSLLLVPALVLASLSSLILGSSAQAANEIIFPVIGDSSFSNDYYAPRSNGYHYATDIIADKGAKLVAVVSGTIVRVEYPQPYWGYSITIESDAGWRYRYIHMNNDTPGTDDGNGGALNAYAVGMKVGDRVNRGQLIGWVGDSGNAESTVPHVHFEKFEPDGDVVNPYYSLKSAIHINTPVSAPRQADEILPNAQGKRGVNVDVGNFAGDASLETVVGLHIGGPPTVNIYNRLNTRMYSFLAYGESFTGGVDVAAGDVDGDGIDEVITGPGKGASPLVKIFKADGTFVDSIFAYPNTFKGGVRVAAGDVDGDGIDEVITGPNAGYMPRVRAFKLDGTVVSDFVAGGAANEDFLGGIDVSAGDLINDPKAEIVTSHGPGSGPLVRVHDGLTGGSLKSFFPYSTKTLSGVRVSVGDTVPGSKEEIATALTTRNVPLVKLYSANGGADVTRLASSYFWEEWWVGYYDVAAGDSTLKGATGVNRRSSVRSVF